MPSGKRDGVAFMEVRVLKAPLLACLTCPLCDYLLREATTISECLHTFCRECISAELSHGDSECCPVCQVSLGTLPLEKLRADHQLNDLKEKLFPSNAKKRKPDVLVGSPRAATANNNINNNNNNINNASANAARRKERSLYSLGVKGPPAVNPGYANRKMRALPGTHGGSEPSSMDEELEDEGDDDDEEDISHDSPTTILKLSSHSNGGSRASPDGSPEAKVYPQSEPRRRPEDAAETPQADGELRGASISRPWTASKVGQGVPQTVPNGHNNNASGSGPAGARDISKYVRGSRKSNSNGVAIRAPAARLEFPSALDALAQVADADAAMEETNSNPLSPSLSDFRAAGSKSVLSHLNSKEIVLAIAGCSQQASQTESPVAAVNGASLQSCLKQSLSGVMCRPSIIRNPRPISGPRAGSQSLGSSSNGIWFHLEAGDVQANEDALPPLSSPFVRIKDVKLPVYHVKTYLVLKLGHKVRSEMEVEITCRGQPVVSSLPLESIRDIWFSAQISDQPQPQPQAQGQAHPQGETSTAPANTLAEFPTSKDFLMVLTYRRHRNLRFN